jgi:hypothetical protein
MFRSEQNAFEKFGADVAQELKFEIDKLSKESERNGLDQAGKRLRDAIAQQQEQINAAVPDRMRRAKLLRASLDLMFASVDCGSRLGHKRVPRLMKARAGKASVTVRAEQAEQKWKDDARKAAVKICKDHPGFSMANVAKLVEKNWDGEFPVSHRWLYKFLCDQNNSGAFQKVDR